MTPDLRALADAYRVATSYEDFASRTVAVTERAVTTALRALGVDASTPDRVRRSLADADLRPWRRLAPPVSVLRAGSAATVSLHPYDGAGVEVELRLEDDSRRPVGTPRPTGDRREVDGRRRDRVEVELPADLPTGWHRLLVSAVGESATTVVVVTPGRVELPPALGVGRAWGWMVQLYSVRSTGSWGLGDYADLAALVRWSGTEHGAGLLLCNPLHAITPVPPVQPSPYFPSSRRFRSPLYLRIEDVPEYATADAETRQRVDRLGAPLRDPDDEGPIDRGPAWSAKWTALQLLAELPRTAGRAARLAEFRDREGAGLEDFALFNAIAERQGVPWQEWPEELRRPDSAAVSAARTQLADRVDLHAWVQLLCDEQLAAVSRAASDAGMAVGVVHDLAVGVDPGGADAWALQDVLALGSSVGAPPDSFNQQGQSWGMPPWRPDRLEEAAYAPFRDMVRSVLRHAGGVRIDHVMGLFRLWWVPAGEPASAGTYVGYDADALLGVLALEAVRAGALVVGEDLGTVEDRVRKALSDRGILGSAVLWFEREEDLRTGEELGPLEPQRWRELAMASVTTHDLPTAAGWLTDEHVRVRAALGLLGHPVEEERRRSEDDRCALLGMLRAEGLLADRAGVEDTVLALHAALVRAPSRLVVAALGDALGDRRQPNLPGTGGEQYPSWCLPVADGAGRAVSFERLRRSAAVRRLAGMLRNGMTVEPPDRP